MNIKDNKAEIYSAIVWLLAGLSLTIYCVLGLFNSKIPGVEDLVAFLSTVEGRYIYVAVFISIFIEGLYFVGSFFPGSTLVVILGILSQTLGPLGFVITILTIFVGWCLAGLVNIILARTYRLKISRLEETVGFEVKDRIWVTWFPSFRANYEVGQIIQGGHPGKVFLSSVRVKFWVSLVAGIYLLVLPLFVDITKVSNEEGYVTVAVVAIVSFVVGIVKLKRSL